MYVWSMNRVIIGSDIGLSAVWHQAITWANADLLSIELLETNFSSIKLKSYQLNLTKITNEYFKGNALENV